MPQLPHAAEEVSCKSSIPLKVDAVDKRMCLHCSLQSAKYQHCCFRELANLFCTEEMDRGHVCSGHMLEGGKRKVFQSASIKGYFNILY